MHSYLLVSKCWYELTGDQKSCCKGLRLSSMSSCKLHSIFFQFQIKNTFRKTRPLRTQTTDMTETTETSTKVTVALGALATVAAVAVAAGSGSGAVAAAGTATAGTDVSAGTVAKGRSELRNMGAVLEAMTLAHPEMDRTEMSLQKNAQYCTTATLRLKSFVRKKKGKKKRTQQQDSMSDTPSLPHHLPPAL